MSHGMMRGGLVGALVAWQATFPAVSQAGPILDWLCGRDRTAYALVCPAPTTVASPVTTACAPVAQTACSPCGGATMALSPVVAAQPAVVAAQPVAVAAQPAPAFQTVQAQVPVSVYRPFTTFSPVTGAAVPTMSGCTLVQVQTQRRPAWWDPLGLFGPRAAVSPQPINVQMPTTVALPAATVQPTMGVMAAPTFAAPATGACPGCAATTPAFPSVPSATISPGSSILGNPPAATYPAPPSTGGAATMPADQPPSLNAPPLGAYQGSSYRAAPAPTIAPPTSLAPPAAPSLAPSGLTPASPPPAAENPAGDPGRDAARLQLIPYPGEDESPTPSSAPPLLNSRGKTASLRRVEPWGYVPITWTDANEVRSASAPTPVLAAPQAIPAASNPAAPTWDDGGWRSARDR